MSGVLPIADSAATVREAGRLLRAHRNTVVALCAAQLVAVAAAVAVPWLLGDLVDQVVSNHSQAPVNLLAAVIAMSVVIQASARWIASWKAFRLGENIFMELRNTFTSRLLTLPLAVVEQAPSGDVASRTTQDIEAVADFARIGLPEVMIGALSVVLTLVAALVVDWRLGVCCLIGLPVVTGATRWFSRRARPAFSAELAAQAAAISAVIQTVDGAASIDGLGLHTLRQRKTAEAVLAVSNAQRLPMRLRARWFPLVQLGYQSPVLIVLFVGGLLVAGKSASVGQVASVSMFMTLLIDPFDDVIYWYGEMEMARAAFARIVGVWQIPADDTRSEVVLTGCRIVLRGVHFSYPRGPEVLAGINLEIAPGEKIALVGASGAGKTTLALLIAGVIRPTSGTVMVGEFDLSDVTASSLRRYIALVSQEDYIFMGSVADNVQLGSSDASAGDVQAALKSVGAGDWLDTLPDDIETMLGVDGYQLLPLQAQQIALARIIVKDPAVVILDEATSMFDGRQGRQVDEALGAIFGSRTVISIAHRLDTAQTADRVLVMVDGLVVEDASFPDLLDRNGTFAGLWRARSGSLHARGESHPGLPPPGA